MVLYVTHIECFSSCTPPVLLIIILCSFFQSVMMIIITSSLLSVFMLNSFSSFFSFFFFVSIRFATFTCRSILNKKVKTKVPLNKEIMLTNLNIKTAA